MTAARQIVVVSGAPGAGKSSIAVPLAGALGFALLSKDAIKEALFDALHEPAGDPAYSQRLSHAAMDVLLTLATRCPRVVLDANFKPWDRHQRERLATLSPTVIEVHCRCAPAEAARRFATRAAARHPAHALKRITPALAARYERDMGGDCVIDVDTGTEVDFARLLARVRTALRSQASRKRGSPRRAKGTRRR